MTNFRWTLPLIALAALITSCTKPVVIHERIQDKPEHSKALTVHYIDHLFHDPYFAEAQWGVIIQSLKTGKIWYQYQPDKVFMPASNNKLLTASAALSSLGPDFHFTTTICGNGQRDNSTYKGDLVLRSDGDPTLYTRFYDDPREKFFLWADSLKSLGITHIDGDIIGDDNAWDDETRGNGWSWDYFNNYYAPEIGPLQINENYIDVRIIAPSDSTGSIQLIPSTPSGYYTLKNEIVLQDSGRNRIRYNRDADMNVITFSGTLTIGSDTLEVAPTLHNPTLFYTQVFLETLDSVGISVSGIALDCDEISADRLIATDTLLNIASPPLSEILKKLMKPSQNLYAETLVRAMGFEFKGIGSFDSGRVVVQNVLGDMGIEKGSYRYVDGSGLSRYNYVSPREINTILRSMYFGKDSQVWQTALTYAGIDGTLRRRMRGTRAENNVHGKTGTIANVRGMSGYVTTADGEDLSFSFLINGHLHNSSDTDAITDRALVALANLKRPFRATVEPDTLRTPEK